MANGIGGEMERAMTGELHVANRMRGGGGGGRKRKGGEITCGIGRWEGDDVTHACSYVRAYVTLVRLLPHFEELGFSPPPKPTNNPMIA